MGDTDLGGKNWQRLHRLIYVSAIAAVIHFWWKVKADVRDPAIYAAILGGLLLLRLALSARDKYRKLSRQVKSGTVQQPGAQPADRTINSGPGSYLHDKDITLRPLTT